MKNRKGMTLIEVVVAMAIFGIIMVTLFPAFLILNLTNIVSRENTDANYIAQNVLEYIYDFSQNRSLEDTIDMPDSQVDLTGDHGYTNNGTVGNVTTLTKIEETYTVTVTFTEDQPSSGLTTVLVVVVANQNVGGHRAQLETIVGFED